VATQLCIDDVECPALARDLRIALAEQEGSERAEDAFRAAMSDVIRAIQAKDRFALLKRFIAYGSLLPSWETRYTNRPRSLTDDELARCIDFVVGHMVAKFQGRLAEILAKRAVLELLRKLESDAEMPPKSTTAFGDGIRCATAARAARRVGPKDTPAPARGAEGPDALCYGNLADDAIEVRAVVEIKSMPRRLVLLERQAANHVMALRRGVTINGMWYPPRRVRLAGGTSGRDVVRIFVRPSLWLLARGFRFEAREGGSNLVMDEQELPPIGNVVRRLSPNTWMVKLAWSYDVLRAASFRLAHRYMVEVGEALATDEEFSTGLRTDMTAAEAGMNDLLVELHVAIARQADAEPRPRRRQKTIELYNVLAFGWALGHDFRDGDGDPCMMDVQDLRERSCAVPGSG
jgi:hypothetical protein